MLYLWLYVAMACSMGIWALWADRHARDVVVDTLALLAALALWPYALGMTALTRHRRKQANKAAKLRRFELRAELLRHRDFDAWWNGLDFQVDAALNRAGHDA